MKTRSMLLGLGLLGLSTLATAADYDIVGKWRNIDDTTGFSKGIVEITKDANGVYSGRIIEVIPRPGYTPKTHCDKCTGKLKNHPVLGFPAITGIKKSPNRANTFDGGHVTDPLNGKTYKASIRVVTGGKRIHLRGYVGVEALGRSQIWIKHE